jgi:hypothetical protein
MQQKFHQLEFRVKTTNELLPAELKGIHALFGHTYRQTDHSYLDASLSNLSNIALALKPNSIVVQGSGKPVGYSDIEIQASETELLPFKQVNRDEGDSLLGIAWFPDAPPGW